ncbi:MAG: hypothetical protein E7558_08415, partial [Ruminococcaceae bacterium]|nr:hypothetical protein [Oscillospiraceae bacterium]
MKFSKQILSVLLCLAMLMSYVPLTAVAADAVSYIDCTWDGIKVVKTTKTVTEYTVVTSGTTTMTDGWYVVNSDVTVSKRISVNGNANLIVADDCTLTANKGIYVSSDKTLDIYGQEKGTGAIVATANNYSYSGIELDGSITIHGGNITATGGDSSGEGIGAGIGGYSVDSITIYDGVITAIGSNVYGWNGCAGIGGIGTNIVSRAGYPSGDIDIYGGIVFATGRNDADDIGGGKGKTGKGARNVTVEGGLIFDRNGSGVLGGTEYTLQKDWTIPEGKTLTVESGKTLIISKGVTLTITGTLTNNGTIVTDCDDTTAYGGNVAYTHMGMATCITSSTCTACGETYLNADNHEKPDDFNYFINTSDKTKHDVKYACCEATKETVAHSLQYSKTADNVLTETCSANCGHSATATLAIENGSYAYTGTTITPATITYSDDWQGEKPTEISYSNNVNAGTATASITAGEATAIVDFTIAKAPLTVTASDATITYGEAPTNNGVTYSGFVNGENENVLGGELAYTYTYTQNG